MWRFNTIPVEKKHSDIEAEMDVVVEIECRIRAGLRVSDLKIIDESEKHKGHAGYRPEGQTHFAIWLVSEDFKGMTAVKRHRLIYRLLGSLIGNEIHALRMVLKEN